MVGKNIQILQGYPFQTYATTALVSLPALKLRFQWGQSKSYFLNYSFLEKLVYPEYKEFLCILGEEEEAIQN